MVNVADILKQVPKGTKLWSNIFGDVEFDRVNSNSEYPISVLDSYKCERGFTEHGYYLKKHENYGECTLWPSKNHRAWDDEAYKILGIEKKQEVPFGLKPFDKVLVREGNYKWSINFFSYYEYENNYFYCMANHYCGDCIPYNDETKHLLGTLQMPPEKYRQKYNYV